jgi:hypothetical protein
VIGTSRVPCIPSFCMPGNVYQCALSRITDQHSIVLTSLHPFFL